MSRAALFDPGLQPERTLLAWRRTCLALAVGIAVGARLTLPALGALSIALGLAGLVLVALAWLGSTQRYRRVNRDLDEHGSAGTGGRSIAALATVAAVIAICGAIFVVLVGPPLR